MCLMDIKQRKKKQKKPSRDPPLTSLTKRAARERNTISKHFLLANFFFFLVGCAYNIVMTNCKWLMHYEMLMERFVKLPTLIFSTYFPLFCFSFLPIIFSNVLNAVFETTSNHSFQVPNGSYKTCKAI